LLVRVIGFGLKIMKSFDKLRMTVRIDIGYKIESG